jgi:hypothetical protein
VLDSSYTDFLVTHPLLFTEASDSLEADNWLRITESKFGLASAWWANFTATLQDGYQVSWVEFYQAFRGHNILTDLIARKLQEFLHPPQSLGSVYEYSKWFNHLSQYDSYHIDTDEKKMVLFRQGLSPVFWEHLTLFQGCTLNELVSASIEQEDACCARIEERGRRGLCLALLGALHQCTA